MHYRTILIAAAVAMLGVGSAYAQELSEVQVCEAAAAAFQAYGTNNGDADLESAKNMVAQGLAACNSGKTAEGLDMINTAIGAISDGKEGSHRNKS
jgi:hypothetical protein